MLPDDIEFPEILRYATYAQDAYLDATELGNQYGVQSIPVNLTTPRCRL